MYKPLLRRLAFLVILFIASISARAQVYTEVGDAGQTTGTAQNSGITQPGPGTTAMIFGSIATATDADVFSLTLSSPALVSFSTANTLTGNSGGSGGLDTALFLFKNNGAPVVTNDDANGFTLQSRIPANNTYTMSLAAGTYLIAISLSGNEPVNTSNQLVFATNPDTTALRGPASGLNPAVFSNFDSNASFDQSGSYEIDISAVPEPASVILFLVGALALTGFALQRRHNSSHLN